MTGEAEFSRTVKLDQLGTLPQRFELEAGAVERAALAARFDLVGLGTLTATLDVHRDGETVALSGRMTAVCDQACVVTGEPVHEILDESVRLRFLPAAALIALEEVELDDDACDTIEHDGQIIDLGEAVSQTLGLALNPFPRSDSAEAFARAAGLGEEDRAGPLAGLAALREKLSGKG